jgi:prepilin-type N-terminal cleavage/methylation domain-containing protein
VSAHRVGDDAGFTLIEVLVGLSLLGIFLGIFTGSIVTLYQSSGRSQAVAHTSQDLGSAFARLDSEVRYASYISVPGRAGNDAGNWYVELRDSTANPPVCTQLRIDQASSQLQQRTWVDATAPSAWTPLAAGVVNGDAPSGAAQPFILTTATATVQAAQLTITLVTREGVGPQAASSQLVVSLAALNTTAATPTGGLCAGMRP